jgi:hypothetical protein
MKPANLLINFGNLPPIETLIASHNFATKYFKLYLELTEKVSVDIDAATLNFAFPSAAMPVTSALALVEYYDAFEYLQSPELGQCHILQCDFPSSLAPYYDIKSLQSCVLKKCSLVHLSISLPTLKGLEEEIDCLEWELCGLEEENEALTTKVNDLTAKVNEIKNTAKTVFEALADGTFFKSHCCVVNEQKECMLDFHYDCTKIVLDNSHATKRLLSNICKTQGEALIKTTVENVNNAIELSGKSCDVLVESHGFSECGNQ